MNLKKLDLNLLVALNALLEEKHVTRAAIRINLSQPAMSRALYRLREMFQDPLLVRGTKGTTLTIRAKTLYYPVQKILHEISHLVSPPSIDPENMQGEIVIATRDYELATLFPKIINQITTKAPKIKLSIVSLIGDDLTPLANQNVDFVLAGTESKSSVLHRYTLYEESFVCLVSKNNSVLQQGMTLETYLEMKHCLVSISNSGLGMVDSLLAKKNLKRHIILRVPHFLAVSYIVANSNLVVTLPLRLGKLLSLQKQTVLIKTPFKVPRFPIYLYWHTCNQKNPMHQWIRKIIRLSC